MRRVMLLRHAKSDWSNPGGGDQARPLNARGRETAPLVGRYLAQSGLTPDLIVCSTAIRTRQTCALVTAELAKVPKIAFEEALYLAEPEEIISVIQTAPAKAHTLMIVGHNPGIHQAAAELTSAGNPEDLQLLSAKFPTAALAVIDFATDDWGNINVHTGRLDRFITPRLLSGKDET
jgi:phosphohistidine phosphatase